MNHNELRKSFLQYFEKQNHKIVQSAPVIPYNDPTLMFTNAGMNQFKEVLLGEEVRSYKRAVSSQKCIRVSGKHNDFEIVGYDGYHHTFFEMLGNWSFGDYYKKEAIEFAWEYLTQVLKFPEKKLMVSIYKDDEESYNIWKNNIKIPEHEIIRLGNIEKGDEENFWSMGETGPCGFCTEIYYKHSDNFKENRELWNLVFMELYKDGSGKFTPLKNKNVDTGMGFERLLALVQGKGSNYHTELFMPMIERLEKMSGKSYKSFEASFQVIVDHIRALALAIADGGVFSNEGRGYVLRKILRRASRHLKKLGFSEPLLFKLVDSLAEIMGDAYPELIEKKVNVQKFIKMEEERFLSTLDSGLNKLTIIIDRLKEEQKSIIPGKEVFDLYDTNGFPVDITKEIARESNFQIDEDGFNMLMEEQRSRGRKSWEGNKKLMDEDKVNQLITDLPITEFKGYEHFETESTLLAIIGNNTLLKSANNNENLVLILNATPFYAESGGQVGDKGVIYTQDFNFDVYDTQKIGNYFFHLGKLSYGEIKNKEKVMAKVDKKLRLSTMRNHTSTHLLQAALRKIVGTHIVQAGSQVSPERLRFDFRHYEALTSEQIAQIEKMVNEKIQESLKVEKFVMEKEEAIKMGAMAIFGEKYGEKVRVIKVNNYSTELCGGTHLDNIGTIGLFMILSEASIASGIRRIEAITGEYAFDYVQNLRKTVSQISSTLKTPVDKIEERVSDLLKKSKDIGKGAKDQIQPEKIIPQILEKGIEKKASKLIIHEFIALDNKQFNHLGDQIKTKIDSGIVFFINEDKEEDKFSLLLLITDDLVKKGLEANKIIQQILSQVKGTGGGRPDRALGGAKNVDKISELMKESKKMLLDLL